MNTNPIGARYVAPDNLAREPLYFGSGERTLFGWLHRPDGAIAASVGLVICKPFGYEAICSHRTVRAVVEEATGLGMPCLRFDYLGTGDSEDIDPDADQLDVWVRDVVAAVSELRRATGVARVCLLGFRLGALIATLAAAQCEAVGALALVAPVISGRRYLNELRVTQLVSLAAASTSQSSSDPDAGQRAPHTGSIEAAGYLLSAATVTRLARIDLATLGTLHASQMLIIDRDDLPSARAWVDTARRLGPQVQYQTSPGYVGILRSPQFAVVPRTIVATLRDWLVRFESARPERSDGVETTKASPRAPAPPTTTLLLPGDGSAPEMRLRERPLWFGADGAVFGIVTEPRSNEIRRRAVILINAGADNHTGASRMHVLFARQWARRGYVVLRMDLAGLGDSDTRPGRPDDEVFPPAALDDIRAAIELMRSRYSVGEVTLAGLCSGAYHALRAAVAGQPVNRILMVNPQNFFWDYSTTLEDVQLAEVVRNPGVYRERLLSAAAWRRVFAGKVNVWRIVQIHFQRLLLTLESTLRDLARRLRIRLPRDVGWELEEIDSRGVRTVMVFARGEPGVDLLRLQGGLSVKRLGNRCRIHVIDSADHTFTRSGPRAHLEEILSDELFARITTSAAGTGFRELHGS
jgi:alpha-beta hydrolase superfamily lysophospholipase